jgi:hypothetical protein
VACRLRSLGAIETGVAKKVPLIHMLIFKYGVDWKELVNAPQGNKDDIEKAQKLLDEVPPHPPPPRPGLFTSMVCSILKRNGVPSLFNVFISDRPLFFSFFFCFFFSFVFFLGGR